MKAKQLSFEVCDGGKSQTALIKHHLRAKTGEWVAMPELYKVSGAMAVHSRISDLNKPYREAGLRLPYENQTDNSSRPHLSWYRYNP